MIKKITKITLFSFLVGTMICLLGCKQPSAPETTSKVTFNFPDTSLKPITVEYPKGSLIKAPDITYPGAKSIEYFLSDNRKWDFDKDIITQDITLNIAAVPYNVDEAILYIDGVIKKAEDEYIQGILKPENNNRCLYKYDLHVAFGSNSDINNFITRVTKIIQPAIYDKPDTGFDIFLTHSVNLYIYGTNKINITESFPNLSRYWRVEELYIMNNIEKIGENFFGKLWNGFDPVQEQNFLKKIVIKDGVKSIGDEAFEEQENLIELVLPNTLESIGNSSFQGAHNLLSLQLPESLKTIGNDAFTHNIKLQKVTLPDSVISIGERLFYECFELTEVKLSNSLKELPSQFLYQTKVKEITIPKSVKRIHKDALDVVDQAGQFKLEKVYFEDTSNPVTFFYDANNEAEYTPKTNDAKKIIDEISKLDYKPVTPTAN